MTKSLVEPLTIRSLVAVVTIPFRVVLERTGLMAVMVMTPSSQDQQQM